MKTVSFFLSILMISFMLTACQQEAVIEEVTNEVSEIQTEFMGKRAVSRPFKADFVSTPIAPPAPDPARCGVGGVGSYVVALSQAGNGNATHMGNITLSINSCIDLGPLTQTPPSPPIVLGAEMTITAANGDEVYLEGSGNQGAPWNILGGTGRFANASGVVTGTFTPTGTGSFKSTLVGKIVY